MNRAHRRRNNTTSPMRPVKPRGANPDRVTADGQLGIIAWWRKQVDDPLFVYFIQDGDDGPVKIGKALNPVGRLAELQCGNPRPLTLRAVVLAAIDTEAELHRMWRFACIRGEWFGGDDEHQILELATACQHNQIETWVDRSLAHITTLYPVRQIRPTGWH